MAAFQPCVDYLLSAGGSYVPNGNQLRLFYIDKKDSDFVLSYKDCSETTQGPLQKVIDGVKENSSAIFLPNQLKPLILCVSPSSTLRALEFDEDEDEWTDSISFESSAIHPSGQLAAIYDHRENFLVFFQNPAGQLIVTQGSSFEPLPANAIPFTPLSATFINGSIALFYIAQDNFIHYLTDQSGRWVDAILAQETFKHVPKRFVAFCTAGGDINVLAISENSALVLVTSKRDKSVLGKVDPNGKFTPGTTEESGVMFYTSVGPFWYPGLYDPKDLVEVSPGFYMLAHHSRYGRIGY